MEFAGHSKNALLQQQQKQQQQQLQEQTQQHQQQNQTGTTVFIAVDRTSKYNSYNSYKAQHSVVLGGLHIAIGLLLFILNITAICLSAFLSIVGHGIWCGIFFVLTGSFGVAARSRSRCLVITLLVLSILSSTLTIFLISLSAIGLGFDQDYYGDWRTGVVKCQKRYYYSEGANNGYQDYPKYPPKKPYPNQIDNFYKNTTFNATTGINNSTEINKPANYVPPEEHDPTVSSGSKDHGHGSSDSSSSIISSSYDYGGGRILSDSCLSYKRAAMAMNGLMLLLGIAEAVVSIWSAVICCQASCCNSEGHTFPGRVQYHSGVVGGGGQMVFIQTSPGQWEQAGAMGQPGTVLYQQLPVVLQQGGGLPTVSPPYAPASRSATEPPAYSPNADMHKPGYIEDRKY